MARNCGAAALQSNGVRRCFREVGSVRDYEQARWPLLACLLGLDLLLRARSLRRSLRCHGDG